MKAKRVIILGVLLLSVVSLMVLPGCTKETGTETPPTTPTEPKTVTFPDKNLEVAIKKHLGKGPVEEITPAELAALISFEANGRGITDLSGLAYCSNLTELWLGNNHISDVSHLASLTNLATLLLDENRITDVSPLASMTDITRLSLDWNWISDISPLLANIGLAERCLSSRCFLNLRGNPLNVTSIEVYIPQLEERGVIVSW